MIFMEEKVFFDGEFGKICGVLHKANDKKEIAIIVHGFSSTKDRGTLNATQALEKAGINALRIDLDNRGESELDFASGATIPNYIKQVEATMKYCQEIGYKEISLVGTSYGGTVAFAVALLHPEIKRLVLRVPVVDYKEHVVWGYGKDKVEEFKKQGFVPYFSNTTKESFKVTFDFIEKSYPYSMYKRAKEIQIPTLIIQGDKDEDVDPLAAKRAVKCFLDAKLHIVKGAGHHLGVNGDFSEAHKVLVDFFK
jgi:pimeloyl-ACP methyl ester carboxylesterase